MARIRLISNGARPGLLYGDSDVDPLVYFGGHAIDVDLNDLRDTNKIFIF